MKTIVIDFFKDPYFCQSIIEDPFYLDYFEDRFEANWDTSGCAMCYKENSFRMAIIEVVSEKMQDHLKQHGIELDQTQADELTKTYMPTSVLEKLRRASALKEIMNQIISL